jgi:hypothetical protein
VALLVPKGKSNREHKHYLTSRAIVRLLDQSPPRGQWPRAGGRARVWDGTNRAKRSQFAPERNGGQVIVRKGFTMNWTPRRPQKNEPNLRMRAGGVTGVAVAQGHCAKRSQFPADGQAGPSPRPQALTMPSPGTQMRQTKQISARQAEAGKLQAAPRCRTRPHPATAGNPLPAGCRCL